MLGAALAGPWPMTPGAVVLGTFAFVRAGCFEMLPDKS